MHSQTDRGRHTHTHTDGQTCTDRHWDTYTNRQTDRQTNRTCLNTSSVSVQYRCCCSPPCNTTTAPFGHCSSFNCLHSRSRLTANSFSGTFRVSPPKCRHGGLYNALSHVTLHNNHYSRIIQNILMTEMNKQITYSTI